MNPPTFAGGVKPILESPPGKDGHHGVLHPPSRTCATGEPALVITVHGTPAPQGSKRYLGNGIMIESSQKVKPWREAVKYAALDAILTAERTGVWTPLGTSVKPLWLHVVFTLPRPASHYGTGRNAGHVKPSAPAYPAGYPDSSKLLRSTEDALTDAGVWVDDARVVHHTVWKVYPGEHADALTAPGAVIRIREVTP